MFTGIIEEIGSVKSVRKGRNSSVLTIGADKVLEGTKLGDSIAVNGVCLTVTRKDASSFSADVMHETLNRSSLGSLRSGNKVNLERAMAADGRFGGHIVAGHIDGIGKITAIQKDDNAIWYTVKTIPGILKYMIEKGSVTVDGISLTVAAVAQDSFKVSVIPHTAKNTILAEKTVGNVVNLENDCIGKYVEKFMKLSGGEQTLTESFLKKFGY